MIQRPQLTEEEQEKKEEQQKRQDLGEEIPAEDLIKDPEPYEERLYKIDEFEDEGQALEEFLCSLVEYQDVVKAKAEKWKDAIGGMMGEISNGEEATNLLKEQVSTKVEFWEQIKINKPSGQLTALLAANAGEGEVTNANYVEMCCKCVRRAMEIGDFTNFDELRE